MERIIVVPDLTIEFKYPITETTCMEFKVSADSTIGGRKRVDVSVGEELTTIVPSGGDSVNFDVIPTVEGKIFVRVAHDTKKSIYRIEIDDLK